MELYFLTSTFRMLYNYRKIASIHPNLFTLFIESLKDKIRIADYEYFIPDGKSENITEKTLLFHNHFKEIVGVVKKLNKTQ